MAFSELEHKRCERDLKKFLERRRPPPHVRSRLDLAYRVAGQSVEIFEIRPHWKEPGNVMEAPVAKTTFVRTTNTWKLFWMRRDLKWHGYEPKPEVRDLAEALDVIDRDEFCCFFG